MDRDLQKQIIESINNDINNGEFDEDLLHDLKDTIEMISSKNSVVGNYKKFIKLYTEAKFLENYLIDKKDQMNFDIWQYFWNKLFEPGGYRDQVFKIYPFKYCDLDSSCEDEASFFMSGWHDACETVQSLLKVEEEMYETNK